MTAGSTRAAPPVRLHGLLATKAPVVCVLRRGPTDWAHVARWDIERGTVEHGAWLHARIFPHRCAISPDGKVLAAFICQGSRQVPWNTYCSLSKVPWLYALAAWETAGTWTTGAHFNDRRRLLLAGALCSPEPFHGTFGGQVVVQPVDTHWVRSRFYRELNTGWREVAASEPWVNAIPAPVATIPEAVVLARPSKPGSRHWLVAVSLWEHQREYYLVARNEVTPLLNVAWAEWHPVKRGALLLATRKGLLRVSDTAGRVSWEYDMNDAEPAPVRAPAWARSW